MGPIPGAKAPGLGEGGATSAWGVIVPALTSVCGSLPGNGGGGEGEKSPKQVEVLRQLEVMLSVSED